MYWGKMSLPGDLEEMDHKLSRNRRGERLDAMTQGLTDRCMIATLDKSLLCCKSVVGEDGTKKLSELCDSRQPYEIH